MNIFVGLLDTDDVNCLILVCRKQDNGRLGRGIKGHSLRRRDS